MGSPPETGRNAATAPGRSSRLPDVITKACWFVAPLSLGVVAWQLMAGIADTPAIPTIDAIASAWLRLFEIGEITTVVGVSLAHALVALALAAGVGMILGVLMGRISFIEDALRPWVDLGMSAPLAVMVPVFDAVLGTGRQVVIATAFIYCVFPILENTRLGVRSTPTQLVEMSRLFGISRRQVVLKVLIPNAMPMLLTGASISVSKAFKGVLLGEMLITVIGLGGRLRYYGAGFQTEKVYALTATTVVVSLIMVALMTVAQRYLLRRYPSGRRISALESS